MRHFPNEFAQSLKINIINSSIVFSQHEGTEYDKNRIKMKNFYIKKGMVSRISSLQSTLIVNLIFTIMFLIHIAIIEYNLQYPDYPSVRIYRKNLKDIEFPISFKLCLRELKNETLRYKNIGYYDNYHFYAGVSLFNRSHFGWNGFTQTHATLGSVEGMKERKKYPAFHIQTYPI